MKKLLTILILSFLLLGSAYAEIFKCKFNQNHTVVIKTDRLNKQQSLVTVDIEKGVFNNDSIIAATGIQTGELIEFKGDKTREHDLVVLRNAKKGSNWSFRAMYFEEVPPLFYILDFLVPTSEDCYSILSPNLEKFYSISKTDTH